MGFIVITLVLAFVRLIFPSIAHDRHSDNIDHSKDTISIGTADVAAVSHPDTAAVVPVEQAVKSLFFNADGTQAKHRIFSVPSYKECFPDSNAVQLVAAETFGVRPVVNRLDAEKRKEELVYIGSNPYFYVTSLSSSIPYLVPRAAVLLQDIGRNFMDSLQIKQIPLHKIQVTSVLRSKEDVAKLRRHNKNATEQSCHLYGTTFDISYTKYVTVQDPAGSQRRAVQNDTLKYVLSEVLRDMRMKNRCYIKYEVKQACFHITVR